MSDTPDYQAIFNKIESTLLRIGSQAPGKEDLNQRLDKFKTVAEQTFTDEDYFRKLVHIIFYSGFKAETVTRKLPVIDGFLSDYRKVAGYGEENVREMMANSGMIRHERKIRGCIDNAKTFRDIIEKSGSFQQYLDSYDPLASCHNLKMLRKDLIGRFDYLSKVTSLHFLMEIGMPVLKPDRVISRIFYRLGLIDDETESEDQLVKANVVGHRFVEATGYPIRYIDIVFVAYGQVNSTGVGVQQGICLKDKPKCDICGVTEYCQYFKTQSNQVVVQ